MEISRRLFLGMAATAPLAPAATWERRPFPEWGSDVTDKVLTDSPWARQLTVPFDFSKSGVRTEAYLVIRWSSALPVREALALEQWGSRGLDSAAARELINTAPSEYVLEVAGFPAIALPKGAAWLEQELGKSARLSVKGRAVPATSCRVPEHGNHLFAALRFPRDSALRPEDGVIEFTAEAGPLSIAQKFRLKAMLYNGRLEM